MLFFLFLFLDLETFLDPDLEIGEIKGIYKGERWFSAHEEVKGEEKIGRDGGKSGGIDRDTCARKICRSCRGNRRKLGRGRGALSC